MFSYLKCILLQASQLQFVIQLLQMRMFWFFCAWLMWHSLLISRHSHLTVIAFVTFCIAYFCHILFCDLKVSWKCIKMSFFSLTSFSWQNSWRNCHPTWTLTTCSVPLIQYIWLPRNVVLPKFLPHTAAVGSFTVFCWSDVTVAMYYLNVVDGKYNEIITAHQSDIKFRLMFDLHTFVTIVSCVGSISMTLCWRRFKEQIQFVNCTIFILRIYTNVACSPP